MVDYNPDGEKKDRLLIKCIYCRKCRNDTGFWEYSRPLDDLLHKRDISHVMCPKCLQKYFPEEFSKLHKEGIITIHKTVSSDNLVTYEIFYKTGNNESKSIFGKYTKGQQN